MGVSVAWCGVKLADSSSVSVLLISIFFSLQRVLIYEVPQAHLDHLGHQVSMSGIFGRLGILGDRELEALGEEAKILLSGAGLALWVQRCLFPPLLCRTCHSRSPRPSRTSR